MPRRTDYDMQHLDFSLYQKVNDSFRQRFIYHAGIDCGFFVEMNYMINAMLYCLDKGYRFQLYSDDANFGTGKGWAEYFEPFCEEVHEPFHHKYNLHRPPQWHRVIHHVIKTRSLSFVFWKLKFMWKSLMGHWLAYRSYGEYVRLSQDVASDHDIHYHIPALRLDCSYYEAYTMLAKMIWRPQPEVQLRIADTIRRLSLPHVYSGVQIRGGDKAIEARLVSGKQIIEALHPVDGEYIFALADNYLQLEIVRSEFPHLHIVSLCQPTDQGYNHKAFCTADPQEKRAAIVRLIVSADLLLHAKKFVGSITTGPSVFILKQRHAEPTVSAVDCAKEALTSVLTLPIDQRAALSFGCINVNKILLKSQASGSVSRVVNSAVGQ